MLGWGMGAGEWKVGGMEGWLQVEGDIPDSYLCRLSGIGDPMYWGKWMQRHPIGKERRHCSEYQ